MLKFDLEEIPLGRNTWFYVQVDGTIRYTFLKYNLPLPKFVVVDETTHFITFNVYRDNIKNPKELKEWNEKWIYVYDELNRQAECNSNTEDEDEYWVKYKFKLL